MFVQMQEQMQNQAKSMFATFPFTPGGAVNVPGSAANVPGSANTAAPASPQANPEPEKK
jgi:hypothetical protein